MMPSERKCALLLILMAYRYAAAKGRSGASGFRINPAMFFALTFRTVFDFDFLLRLENELMRRRWQIVRCPSGQLAILPLKRVEQWPELSTKHVGEDLQFVEDELEVMLASLKSESTGEPDEH